MSQRIEINGHAAGVADLAGLSQLNYGHFTTMQVRMRAARGFDLHLDRLACATRELFGVPLDREQVREWIRRVLDDVPVSLRVTVFSRTFDRARPEQPVVPDVLVATSAARDPMAGPLRVCSVVHERVLPHIKHVGTFDLFHHRRAARLAGHDDVLFTTAAGAIAEGSIWNIGFWDGQSIVWPGAPALHGITWQLLERGLAAHGVPALRRELHLSDLGGMRSAFAMNSAAASVPIAGIDRREFVVDAELTHLLDACYGSQPWEPV